MADAEIEVILRVKDELTSRMDKIEKQIKKSTEASAKSTENLGKSFIDTTNQLIAFGNAANAIDNIQSRLQNTQLRLENAVERVRNAQDSVIDSQTKLNRLQRDGKKDTDEYNDAVRNLERSNRNLNISENNLKRTKGQLAGVVIQVGVETIRFAQAIPPLVNAIKAWTGATTILQALTNPLVLTIGLASAAAGLAAIKYLEASSGVDQFSGSKINSGYAIDNTTGKMKDQLKLLDDFQKKIMGITTPTLPGQDAANLEIAKQEEKIALIKAGRGETNASLQFEEAVLERLRLNYDADFTSKKKVLEAKAQIEKTYLEGLMGIEKTSYEERLVELNKFVQDEVNELQRIEDKQREIANFYRSIFGKKSIVSIPNAPTASEAYMKSDPFLSSLTQPSPFGDFVMRPGQAPTRFSSDDTIIGMKDFSSLRGTTIYITGNIYGVDAKEISRELVKEYNTKVSI